jgi:UDP-2-acetamido-3-amino-2,3-dideoxy-glucuronate N-acetyltransferase
MANYYSHETAIIDEGCSIGEGVKIWHFSHVMPNCIIGDKCNIGQNVVISPDVVLGKNVKIQNNVSIYTGVICEDDVFLGPSWYLPMLLIQEAQLTAKVNMLKL